MEKLIHTFINSGVFTATDDITGAEVVLIAGGGAGGSQIGGGGGAGGFVPSQVNLIQMVMLIQL